eukprot:symbB.v1.2.040145.t1/scaffold7025.1/size13762/1
MPCVHPAPSPHEHREIEQHLRHVSALSGFEDLAIAVESDEQAHNMVSELLDLEALLGNSITEDSSEVHAMVTKLLSRAEMLNDPRALQAIREEAEGLVKAGTWDLESVQEYQSVKDQARKSGVSVHFGQLMTIASIKFFELAQHLQKMKGRIVYRGDCAKDENGAAAVYQELGANPTSVQGLNACLAYGALPGNKTTAADAIKAYVQALLKSKHKTWIELAPELRPRWWFMGGTPQESLEILRNADLDARDESGWLPVHWAAQSGSVETLCNLHYLGADFVSRTLGLRELTIGLGTYVGETALHIAAQYNDGAMIQALLASHANLEELTVDSRTALHLAAVNGQTESLQTLLFYKADYEKLRLNEESIILKTVDDESGLTAFLLAITHERESAVQCMLSDIPLPPKLPIHLNSDKNNGGHRRGSAATNKSGNARGGGQGAKPKAPPAPKSSSRVGKRKTVVKEEREKRGEHARALLEQTAEIRAKLVKTPQSKIKGRLIYQHDVDERTGLCLAVLARNSNLVQILLGAKAELETADVHGNGVLHYACMSRDREQVATFMELNARVDRLNKEGFKPVDLCQEDPDILHMVERKLVSKILEGQPVSPTHAAPPVGINLQEGQERHRIRFESPMMQLLGDEATIKELKLFIKQRGAPKAKSIE